MQENKINEEVTEETAEETPSQEEKKETKKEEKKGFLKKDPKKEKIAQLEKEVEELNGKLAKEKDDYIRLISHNLRNIRNRIF